MKYLNFIIFLCLFSNNIYADNHTYIRKRSISVLKIEYKNLETGKIQVSQCYIRNWNSKDILEDLVFNVYGPACFDNYIKGTRQDKKAIPLKPLIITK